MSNPLKNWDFLFRFLDSLSSFFYGAGMAFFVMLFFVSNSREFSGQPVFAEIFIKL